MAALAPGGVTAEPVWGPHDYVRTGGAANVYRDAFTACAPGRTFRLLAENGAGGSETVRTVSIALNGVEVVASADLASQPTVERVVMPQVDNALEVTLGGSRRGAVRVTVTADGPCGYDLSIQEPVAGIVVPAGLLLVQGTVAGAGEIGVTVNGELAARDGNTFTALLPVAPDTVELAVTAASPTGPVLLRRFPITVIAGAPRSLQFAPGPALGSPPLPVRFSITADAAITQVELDGDGDGVVDYAGPPLDGPAFTYLRPGVYLARVTALDANGARHDGRALVQVVDDLQADQAARARWATLRDALVRSDVAGAASVFSSRSRERFLEQLAALAAAGALPEVAADLADLRFVAARAGSLEYDLRVTRAGVEESYWVLFELDRDGIWRLVTF